MSNVAHPDKDNVARGAGVGLVGLSIVLFFLALASSDVMPGLGAAWVWAISGALTALSFVLALWISGQDG